MGIRLLMGRIHSGIQTLLEGIDEDPDIDGMGSLLGFRCSRIQIDMLGFIDGDPDIDGKDPLWDSDIVGRIRLGHAWGHTDLHMLGFLMRIRTFDGRDPL
jgi:hypothetical protein